MNIATVSLLATLWSVGPTVDESIERALAAEERGEYEVAATHYEWAAANDAQLTRFLRYRALEALLRSPTPDQARIDNLASSAVEWGYRGSALAAVRADAGRHGGVASATVLRAALKSSTDRDAVCAELTESLTQRVTSGETNGAEVAAEVVDLQHGECSDTTVPSLAVAFKHAPSAAARVRRAERLNAQVRFIASVAELEELGDLDALAPDLRCRAWFRLGRSIYRIRKRRAESERAYAKAAEACQGENPLHRRQALYGIGTRHFDLGRLDQAKSAFTTLLTEFEDTSHADDAVFYLARIARAQKDATREQELLALAVEKFSDGDMFAELVWEVHEHLYRDGQYAEFVAAIDAVQRPPRDEQYFSQGRLEYFTAQALTKLGRTDEAYARMQSAWQLYPWSFYGYLSRMRLLKAGESVADPALDVESTPPWLASSGWRRGPLGRLSAHSAQLAASFAPAFTAADDTQRWQLSWVYDRAGNYPVSHNIVRRSIGGRPWGEPADARFVQWSIAFPDPFGTHVDAADRAEAAQHPKFEVHRALPRAIMREESSFIEDVESYAGALGLLQLMPKTALGHDDDIEGRATPDRLKTAEVNVRVGVDHIYWLARRFDSHPVLMVAAYNAGSGAVGGWLRRYGDEDIAMFIEDIPALQTRDYTKRVIGSYAAYQWLLQPGEPLDDRVLGPAAARR